MANPALIKKVKSQEMTTAETLVFYQVKACLFTLITVINSAWDEINRVKQRCIDELDYTIKEMHEVSRKLHERTAKFDTLVEKEKNAGSIQPNLQHKKMVISGKSRTYGLEEHVELIPI